jgi:hypothetical protein
MHAERGSREDLRNAQRTGRHVFVAYLGTGGLLAILRVSLLAWMEHRAATGNTTEAVYRVSWLLYPEALLGGYTSVGAIHFASITQHFLFWASLLTFGSFIIASPILFVGSLMRRRQPRT